LARVDADGDGRISREGWGRKPEAFARLDADGDGYLTREEMMRARKRRGGRGFGV
jgi:hypothetical protein